LLLLSSSFHSKYVFKNFNYLLRRYVLWTEEKRLNKSENMMLRLGMENCHLKSSAFLVNVIGARMKENGTEQACTGLRFRRSRVRNSAGKLAVLIEVFCDFAHCKQIPWQYLNQVIPASLKIFPNSSSINYPFIRCYVAENKKQQGGYCGWVIYTNHRRSKERNKFFVKVHKNKKTLERPKRRWEDNIKTNLR